MECYSGTTNPDKIEEVCDGVYTSDQCIIHEAALTYLGLAANSSIKDIINQFILALMQKDVQIQQLQQQIDAL